MTVALEQVDESVRFSVVERWRLVAVTTALVALAFVQAPGLIVNDTKFDLAVAPGSFLARALDLWDPNGSFGQVQNQAYGYLFPMGPFMLLGDLLALPPWVVQRAWWAFVMCIGFWGVVLLCRHLGIGRTSTQTLGALVYVLSPRMLTVIGPSSIEVWPMATAPWVLLALVIGLRRGDPRRWAAAAALAVAATGGVNAAATAAVLPLGVLLLLSAAPGPRRRALMLWWPLLTVVATAWWWIPLLLLGSVSPPFLDFIESASTTTFAATPFDALRGTTNWLPYLDASQRAGSALVTEPLLIVSTTLLVALGVWGLAHSDLPRRGWLVSGVVVGLLLLTAGGADGWGQATIAGWLDGVLAPLRNTHKFDLVVRLPLVLGLVHAVSVAGTTVVRGVRVGGVAVLAAAALLSATTPAWTADLDRGGSLAEVPGYWEDATDWMAANAAEENTLVLPGSAFGDFLWGRPRDEPVQALGSSPWSLRNAVPLVPPAGIRSLDALETAFGSGRGSSELTAMLRRYGIRYVLVRADLDAPGVTDPAVVQSTLASTPDVEQVARFGPLVGSPATQETDDGETVFVNGGRQGRQNAVEIFEVRDATRGTASVQPLQDTPVLVGDPAAQLLGVVPSTDDLLLAPDVPGELQPTRVVLTDTDRRQEVAFGRVTANRSASIALDEEYRLDRRVHDYVRPGDERWKAVPSLDGARSLRASSSVADVDQAPIDRAGSPFAAFDGDPSTSWRAADFAGSIEVDYGRDVDLSGATLLAPEDASPRTVEVTTDEGSRSVRLLPGRLTPIDLGTTSTLRVSVDRPSVVPLAIASIDVPDAPVTRPLRLPGLPEAWDVPTDVLLTADAGQPTCWEVRDDTRCVPGRDGRGEDGSGLDRLVPLNRTSTFATGLSVRAVEGEQLHELLAGPVRPTVTSTGATDPAAGALAMVDGNPRSGWIAALDDTSPTIALSWDGEREVDTIRLLVDGSLAASAPRRATVESADGVRQDVTFDVDGVGELSTPVSTEALTIRVRNVYVRSSLGFDGSGTGLPVGVSEVSLPGSGLDPTDEASSVVELPCGSGPTVAVDGTEYRTSVSASRTAVVGRAELPARLCDDGSSVTLGEGDTRVAVAPSPAFRPTLLRLRQGPDAAVAELPAADVERDGRSSLSVSGVAAVEDTLVTIAQTVNPGWQSSRATGVPVNGWMQGFVTDETDFTASFAPSLPYRAGLLGGAVALLLLVVWWRREATRVPDGPEDTDAPEGVPSGLRVLVCAVLGVTAAGLVGGTRAAVLAVVVGALVVVSTGWRRRFVEGVAPLAIVAAGLAYALAPWNSPRSWAGEAVWPQLAVVVAVAVVAGLLLPNRGGRRQRIDGRSTTR